MAQAGIASVTIVVGKPATVSGRLLVTPGRPLGSFALFGAALDNDFGTALDDGRFSFTGLPPGTFEFMSPFDGHMISRSVTVTAGASVDLGDIAVSAQSR